VAQKLKKARTNSSAWIKKHLAFVIFLIIIACASWKPIYAYFTWVQYEDLHVAYRGEANPVITKYFKIIYKTPSAFLPFEKIKVEAYYAPVAPDEQARARTELSYLKFLDGYFTQNEINKEQATKYNSDRQLTEAIDYMIQKNSATLLFHSTDIPNLYKGECELIYKKEGLFPVKFCGTIAGVPFLEDMEGAKYPDAKKIRIGSTTDLMNKKTNDLLFIIAVLGIIIPFYFEFRKKTGLSKPLEQYDKPTGNPGKFPKR
jgi:hypothetical protein